MKNITENLTNVISEITFMERENEILNQKNKELLDGFDTDTHILLNKDEFNALLDDLDTIVCQCNDVISECETMENSSSEAKYYAEEIEGKAKEVLSTFEEMSRPKKEETKKSD